MKIQNRDYVNERASSVLQKKILCIKEYKNPQTKLCFNKGSATLCVQPSLTRPPEATPQKRRFGGKTPLYTRLRVETDEDMLRTYLP